MCAYASRSGVSDSLGPHGLQSARLLCPWDYPGKNGGGVAISSSRDPPALGCGFSTTEPPGSPFTAYHRILNIVPCAVQWGLVVNPSYMS